MPSTAGPSPPLHRRFNEAESLRQIGNRYRSFRERFGPQVAALQASRGFRALARGYYAAGYKDWHILLAVFNLRVNTELRRLGVDTERPERETVLTVREIVERSVEPADQVVEAQDELQRMFFLADATCLQTYGFEPRRPDIKPAVVQKFLRERMRHYDLDLPHDPLFADPVGKWPEQRECDPA